MRRRPENDPELVFGRPDSASRINQLLAAWTADVAFRGASHFLFSDDGALFKSHIVLGTLRMMGILGIDGRRQLAITTYCVHRFFDAYLKGPGVSRLDLSSPLYPEIEVLE